MKYLKTASFCALILGIVMACCFQHFNASDEQNTPASGFFSKGYQLDAYKSQKLPATPINITKVYRKYRDKSLHITFHFISDDHFVLLEQDPRALLSWRSDENILSSCFLFKGSRAPPAVC